MAKTEVIFLCTGNSAQSQMAEAFLGKYAGDHFEVYSAGFEPPPTHPARYWSVNYKDGSYSHCGLTASIDPDNPKSSVR